MAILKQSIGYTRVFNMVTSASHYLPLTGASPVVNISKNGGNWAVAANSPATEILASGPGFYKIALSTTETNTVGDLAYYITAASGDAKFMVDQVRAKIVDDIALDGSGNVSIAGSIKRNQPVSGYTFVMTDSVTGAEKPGLGSTITAQRSLSGAGFAPCASAPTEVGNGTYAINLGAADTNSPVVMLRFTATGANTLDIQLLPQP